MSLSITSARQAQQLIEEGKIKKGAVIISVNGMFQVIGGDNMMTDLKEIIYDEETDTENLGMETYYWTAYDFVGNELAGSGEGFEDEEV